MLDLLALTPILLVLLFMARWHWGAHKAGLVGWAAALLIATLSFGLTPSVFFVSQAKGFLLSIFVLAVMWPALFLFHWLNAGGAIGALAKAIEQTVSDRGMCAVIMAWALSGMLEGIAGFGLPVAIVSPMVVAVGIPPVRAVTAVAIGHSWAVSFGSMGVIFQTLVTITGLPPADLVPRAAVLLGVTCLACGLAVALILGQLRNWPTILVLSLLMGVTQWLLARIDLVPLSALGAGATGLGCYLLIARTSRKARPENLAKPAGPPFWPALATYGSVAIILSSMTLYPPLHKAADSIAWKASFSPVTTRTGFITPAGSGPVIRFFSHPGSIIAAVGVAAVGLSLFARKPWATSRLRVAGISTWKSGLLASLGILLMVGISTLMEHCGMSLLLAEGATKLFRSVYPLVSPLVGVLGAFATGSNNNSNIMFAPLQRDVAVLLQVSPALLVAAQTAGGSLGSLLAPAKLVIGCATAGIAGEEGKVLRRTLPYGIIIALVLGALTLALVRIR